VALQLRAAGRGGRHRPWLGACAALLLASLLLSPAVRDAPATASAVTAAVTAATAEVPGGPEGGPPLDPAPPASPRGHLRAWAGTPSDVAGGIAYSAGEVIVTDNPYDDHGGDTNPLDADPTELLVGAGAGANSSGGYAPGLTGGANGDYDYPPGAAYGLNAADIVETRVAIDASSWYLLVRLNTLNDPSLTAIEARIDGHVLLAHGDAATLDGQPVEVVADADQALFEVRVPRAAYDPGAAAQAVLVAAGLWDAGADDWLAPAAGKPPYFDLAYVPGETLDVYWRDRVQSLDIVNDTLGGDSFDVDFGALATGGCPTAGCYDGPGTGLFSRVFRSGQPLGRGVSLQQRYAQDSSPVSPPILYRSPYQPYAIYRPQHPTGAMVLLLHFLGGNYMSYSMTSMPAVAGWAEQLGVTVVMPLARGEGGWYEGEAEKDVFEAWRDVAMHYPVDPDRVYLAGMSMGGFGTWRLTQLYPDLFARGIIWAGPVLPNAVWVYPDAPPQPSCGPDQPADCGYNLEDLFGNDRNVPLLVVHGGIDELVPSTGAEHWMADYRDRGGATYRYLFLPDHHHETNFPASTAAWVLQWLDGLPPRDTNPVHVSYHLMRHLFQPQYGITYDGAYWAHGLVLADGVDVGDIDATRGAGPDQVAVMADRYGVDSLGPYRLGGQDVTPATPTPDSATVRLAGLSGATLDTARMGWAGDASWRVRGETDVAVDLSLTDDRAREATGAAYTQAAGRIVLHLPAGAFDVTVSPVLGLPAGLPNTSAANRGGGAWALLAAQVLLGSALVAAVVVRRGRRD
jgi:predicted esterase